MVSLKNILSYTLFFSVVIFVTDNVKCQTDSTAVDKNSGLYPMQELRNQLDDIFDDPNFTNANWGVYISSLKTGEVLYKKNENKLFIPASVLKLFTTASSLLLLGANYQYDTGIYSNGKIEDGELIGDLIIRGSGDPTISGRFFSKNTEVFENWANSLIGLGINSVDGELIGDDQFFDDIDFGRGWAWDYESYWFAAPVSALSFNDNSVDISIEPSATDMPAYFSISPQTKYVDVINNVKTTGRSISNGIRVYRGRGKNLISVYGNININANIIEKHVSVNNPTLYFVTVLNETLEKKGISINGSQTDFNDNISKDSYDSFELLLNHKSPLLKDLIKEINKNSNNFCAEQLLKTLGLELFGLGSIENGVHGMMDLLKIMGINSSNMVVADGSGLSRLNLITPKQIVNLLTYMYKSNEFKNFYESLPIAGIDGTLANRMKYSATKNNVRAKSGFIEGVNSLAGYLKTADGEQVAFTIIVNNFLVPNSLASYVEDIVCANLANFSRN